MDKIDVAVLAYQSERTDALFLEVYNSLEATRKKCFGRMRKSLPSAVTDADIYGIIDDAIMKCVKYFDPSKGSSFVTYLCKELESRRKDHVRHVNAEKRRGDMTAAHLDAPLEDDGGTTIGEQLQDTGAVNVDDLLAAQDIISSLTKFKEMSEKNSIYAALIAFDYTYFETREEKHDAMRLLLGKDFTTSGIHKKIKKAKLAFKQFLENN